MRIDLHLHSTASDGALPPDAVVRAARDAGLDIIALTDHDTVAGVPAAVAEAAADGRTQRPVVIPGIEVSSTLNGTELHILGYFVDPEHEALREFGEEAARRRLDRMRGMVTKLERLGIQITLDDVVRAAGPEASVIGRPHLARALVERGAVATFTEAFERYIADDGPAFLPTEMLTPGEAIDLIHGAGGIAVWAHPPHPAFENELRRMVGWGLDGIECFRPRNTPEEVGKMLDGARRYDLLTTGGSDWHGGWHGPLGSFHLTRDQADAFLERGGL